MSYSIVAIVRRDCSVLAHENRIRRQFPHVTYLASRCDCNDVASNSDRTDAQDKASEIYQRVYPVLSLNACFAMGTPTLSMTNTNARFSS